MKAIQAKPAVKTPSRFNRSEAFEAGIRSKPFIKKTGPSTPPNNVARPSQGRSCRGRKEIFDVNANLKNRIINRPNAEPKYKKLANCQASTSFTNSFANGVLAPKRPAASNAKSGPFFIS